MRPVGLHVIGWAYLFTIGLFIADIVFLAPLGVEVQGISGTTIDTQKFLNENSDSFQRLDDQSLNPERGANPIDRILQFSQTGFVGVWELLGLLTGSYIFLVMAFVGVPLVVIQAFQLIWGFIVVMTVIYYVTGRG